ncbi:hypothetical protein GGX14DRAFT_485021 [Mycena pura]|uniref:F-box domain-containing protein n=1 Tax=Mycena pura TaxID=153505 RepID=A0AAD6Y0Z4_9AGAR|nr:hypothetical protein GGX14DRAFT_485021 [Mycena pura]
MSDDSECTHLCMAHCIDARSQPPQSPCVNLLSNNFAPRDDSQIHEIRNAIQGAEAELDRLQDRLRATIARITSQRAALQEFVNSHRGVACGLRRFPNEILVEIFSHCIHPTLPPCHPDAALSSVISVCTRWRAVALASPSLWRYFTFDGDIKPWMQIADLRRLVSLQVQRSSGTPLSVRLMGYVSDVDFLDVLLKVSCRWQTATLQVGQTLYNRLFKCRPDFTILKELTLEFEEPICDDDVAAKFVQSLPSLVDLTLQLPRYGRIPDAFKSLWPQLLACTLVKCTGVFPILPSFSPDTRLTLWRCSLSDMADPLDAPVHSAISALTIRRCYSKFVDELAKVLVAPRLKKFAFFERNGELSSISRFLGHSSCTLTHLTIHLNAYSDATLGELLTILDSPCARYIVDLDLHYRFPKEVVDALATRDIVPVLRSLSLRDCRGLDDADVMALHARRRPVLQQLCGPANSLVLSQGVVQALEAAGLEVVITAGR